MIETAPKDGTACLIYEPPDVQDHPQVVCVHVGWWVEDSRYVNKGHWGNGTLRAFLPTHWMSLPPQPEPTR